MDMIEKVREALRKALEDRAWHDSNPGDVEICIDNSVDLTALARSAIAAMREPTEGMLRAGLSSLALTAVGMPEFEPKDEAELCFVAMVDAALADGK